MNYNEMNSYELFENGKKDGFTGNNKVKEVLSCMPINLKKKTLFNKVESYMYGYKVGMIERKLGSKDISLGGYSDSILQDSAREEVQKLLKKAMR